MNSVIFGCLFVSIVFAWWSPPQNVGIPGADDLSPGARRVQLFGVPGCVVWQTDVNGNWDIYSRFGGAGTWGDTAAVTSHPLADVNPAIAYDNMRNRYWCVWQRDSAGVGILHVAQSDQVGGWLPAARLNYDGLSDINPSIFVNIDTVWVVWQTITAEASNIFAACYDGTSWTDRMAITSDSMLDNVKPVVHGRYDKPIVVWERDSDIYYSEYSNQSWQTPIPVTTDPASDINPDINSESFLDDHTYGSWIVWQTDRDGNYEIYTTGKDSFAVHHRLTSCDSLDAMPNSMFFVGVIARTGPTATAFERRENGNYDIFTYIEWWGGSDSIIQVTTDPAEDRVPVASAAYEYIWVLWQSNRNDEWDIYGSWMYVGGSDEGANQSMDVAWNISPNPFRDRTKISLCSWLPGEQVTIAIIDCCGRMVAEHALSDKNFTWDGCDEHGLPVAPGIYFVHLHTPAAKLVKKAIKIAD